MPGHTELTGLAVVAVAALACGILLTRLRQPAIVGYILAGVLLGPSGLALVEDRGLIVALAELGVLMLLFVIGIELSLRALARVWRIALLTTGLQIGISVGVMLLLSRLLGWSPALSILLGFAVAISSTTVAIKILEDIGGLRTPAGRLAVAVLIAQDLAIVPMMLIIDAMAPTQAFDFGAVATIIVAVGILTVLIRHLTRRERVRLPLARWVAGSFDLTALTGLAYCFAAAAAAGLVGLSAAFGAFLAGLIIGSSAERAVMLNATKPIQSVLLMAFFLSVGLLIDLGYIWREIGTVLLLLLFVTVLKTALNVAILHLLGVRWRRAFLAGTVLGQVGEFSFVLIAAGVTAGIMGPDGERLIVAVIALSLVISPLWLLTARRLHGLAAVGVSTLGQLLDEVYGREKALVRHASGWATARWEDLAGVALVQIRRGGTVARRLSTRARTSRRLGEWRLPSQRRVWRAAVAPLIAAVTASLGRRTTAPASAGAAAAEGAAEADPARDAPALDGEIIPPPPRPPEPLDWTRARAEGEVPPPRRPRRARRTRGRRRKQATGVDDAGEHDDP